MSTGKIRVAALVALHFLVLGLAPTAAPSNPIVAQEAAAAPSAEEIAVFEELVEWIGDDDLAFVTSNVTLRDVIQARQASFDVFSSYLDDSIRYQRLEGIPYGEEIRRAAERHGVDGLLIAAIVEAESSFDPCAVSHRGAVGLMQVMPANAGPFGLDSLTEPERNIDLGTRYLRHLLEIYDGDLALALAAYNAGPGNVRRFGGLPPFRETRRYVEKVLTSYVDHHQEAWRKGESLETLGLTPSTITWG